MFWLSFFSSHNLHQFKKSTFPPPVQSECGCSNWQYLNEYIVSFYARSMIAAGIFAFYVLFRCRSPPPILDFNLMKNQEFGGNINE